MGLDEPNKPKQNEILQRKRTKWSTDDVMLNAEHLDVKLTEEEAESIP